MEKQILIRNGKVFTGNPDEKAAIQNILIRNGKIEKVSREPILCSAETEIIDASGKWITPGFIDTHTHYDAEVIASPGLKESARHGVTTVILGSCSVSAIYNNPEETSDSFTRVEAIPRSVMLPLMEKEKNGILRGNGSAISSRNLSGSILPLLSGILTSAPKRWE